MKTIILGKEITFPFIQSIKTKSINSIIQTKQKHKNFLIQQIDYLSIEKELENCSIQEKIKLIQDQITKEVCSNIPNAFWSRKKHSVELPYIDNFDEKQIKAKARPIQMNEELLEHCKNEITELKHATRIIMRYVDGLEAI